jgi:AmmeMemoRadiSam system protein B
MHTGHVLPPEQIEGLVNVLDEALLLDNDRFRSAKAGALEAYRRAAYRQPSIAGSGYPADPAELRRALGAYCLKAAPDAVASGDCRGLISPHIDFARGWETYARVWSPVKPAVQRADLVIIIGTDHSGSPGSITLTRQSYATPWGVLPTDTGLVDRLASVLGEEAAFREEHHHLGEHSIELASVWLHYMAEGAPKRVLPVLCGQHEPLLVREGPAVSRAWAAVEVVAEAAAAQRTLVVAAGDLSHVGPAFGDQQPFDAEAKGRVRSSDEQYLRAACSGDAGVLKGHVLDHGDPTRICGSAPIHYLVHALHGTPGSVLHYDQCPADDSFGSLVSIAGVVYRG